MNSETAMLFSWIALIDKYKDKIGGQLMYCVDRMSTGYIDILILVLNLF